MCYSYPHEECEDKSMLHSMKVKGLFTDLTMRAAVKIDSKNISGFINLFSWNEIECDNLDKLSLKGGMEYLDVKKSKHLLSFFELAYSLAIEPSKNMTTPPPCFWQTKFNSA